MSLHNFAKAITPPFIISLARRMFRRGNPPPTSEEYLRGGRVPWSPGYIEFRNSFIASVLTDARRMEIFRGGKLLPSGYGIGLDERCVEYPWLLSQISGAPERMLDAGSSLNYAFILVPLIARGKILHIVTLAPEANCFWEKGVSYFYADLRELPMRDGYYDSIACVSTLEHVGMDNALYTRDDAHKEQDASAFTTAIRELHRVLKPGGTLYLSVPFGKYDDFGTFQQFDRTLLSKAERAFPDAVEISETFFRYSANGWQVSSDAECADCKYVAWINTPPERWPTPIPVEHDRAAAARSVACVKIRKK